MHERIKPVHRPGQQLSDAHEAAPHASAAFGDVKHLPFRVVDQFLGTASFRAKCRFRQFTAHADKMPEHRTLAHDVGIGAHIVCRGCIAGQGRQIGETTGLLQLVAALQPFGQRHRIEGGVTIGESSYGAEYEPVVLTVEILFPQAVRHLFPGGVIQHQAAQHRLLRFHRMGRHTHGLYRRGGGGIEALDGSRHAGW